MYALCVCCVCTQCVHHRHAREGSAAVCSETLEEELTLCENTYDTIREEVSILKLLIYSLIPIL